LELLILLLTQTAVFGSALPHSLDPQPSFLYINSTRWGCGSGSLTPPIPNTRQLDLASISSGENRRIIDGGEACPDIFGACPDPIYLR